MNKENEACISSGHLKKLYVCVSGSVYRYPSVPVVERTMFQEWILSFRLVLRQGLFLLLLCYAIKHSLALAPVSCSQLTTVVLGLQMFAHHI